MVGKEEGTVGGIGGVQGGGAGDGRSSRQTVRTGDFGYLAGRRTTGIPAYPVMPPADDPGASTVVELMDWGRLSGMVTECRDVWWRREWCLVFRRAGRLAGCCRIQGQARAAAGR